MWFKKFRTPEVVYQNEISECGLACVCMIAGSFGHPLELTEVRKKHPVSIHGASLAYLTDILEEYGIDATPVEFDLESIAELPTPAIVHFGGNHFVVLNHVKGKYAYISDPALGGRLTTVAAIKPYLSGYAILCRPTSTLKTREQSNDPQKSIKKMFMTLPTSAKGAAFFSVIAALGVFVVPTFIFLTLDNRISLYANAAWSVALLFLLATTASQSIEYLAKTFLIRKTIFNTRIKLVQAFNNLLSNHFIFFSRRKVGDLNSRFASFERSMLSTPLIKNEMLVAFTISVIAIVGMLSISVLLSLLSFVTIIFYGLCSTYYQAQKERLTQILEKTTSEKNDFFIESVRGVATIKTAGLYKQRGLDYSRALKDHIAAVQESSIKEAQQKTIYTIFSSLELVFLIVLAYPMLVSGELSFGLFYVFSLLRQVTLSSTTACFFGRLKNKVNDISNKRAEDFLFAEKDPAWVEKHDFALPLQISDLSYGYEENRQIVKNINLSLMPGDKIAITGVSGCGKSTLLKLISGLITVKQGSLFAVNEDKLQPLEWSYLAERSFISLQGDVLFEGTLKDNMTLFNDEITNEQCMHYIRELDLNDVISQLPAGLATRISENTSFLSSGQKQRIMLARAFLHQKPLLILDEPTSNLDSETEMQIFSLLAVSKKTLIVVTHETSNLHNFNHVYHMENGELTLRNMRY